MTSFVFFYKPCFQEGHIIFCQFFMVSPIFFLSPSSFISLASGLSNFTPIESGSDCGLCRSLELPIAYIGLKGITFSSNAPSLWPKGFSFSTIEQGKISLSEQALIKWPSRGPFLSSIGSWQGRIHSVLSENLVFWYSTMTLFDPFSRPHLVRKYFCCCCGCCCFAGSFYSIVVHCNHFQL